MSTDKTKTENSAVSGDLSAEDADTSTADGHNTAAADGTDAPREWNGPKGPEPTRYGDWEQKGRCSDF